MICTELCSLQKPNFPEPNSELLDSDSSEFEAPLSEVGNYAFDKYLNDKLTTATSDIVSFK